MYCTFLHFTTDTAVKPYEGSRSEVWIAIRTCPGAAGHVGSDAKSIGHFWANIAGERSRADSSGERGLRQAMHWIREAGRSEARSEGELALWLVFVGASAQHVCRNAKIRHTSILCYKYFDVCKYR